MKPSAFLFLSCLIPGLLCAATPPDAARRLATAPLRFEPAASGSPAQFVARGPRYNFSFKGSEAIFRQSNQNIRFRFEGATPRAQLEPIDKLHSTTNVFLGSDPAKWRRDIPAYARLQMRELYPGIDLVYYGNAGELEYDLAIKPGADPNQIKLRLNGTRARLDRLQKPPVAYQIAANGTRVPVESRYRKNPDGSYGFALGRYDRSRDLVIDPVLSLSAYFAGSALDIVYAIGHDSSGFLYISGQTYSTDLPMPGGPLQGTNAGNADLFLYKIDPNADAASQIVYATYLGGTQNETFGGMALSPKGDVYLTGTTASGDFPMANAAQTALNGAGTTDAFVVWLDPSQNLAYSSYLGGTGNDIGLAITFDNAGKIYVTGGTMSDDFSNVAGFQTTRTGSQDAFVTVIDPSQSGSATIQYSTYFGGSGFDTGRGIAVTPDGGTIWLVGGSYSGDLPVTSAPYQHDYRGGGDAFVAGIKPALGANALIYASYLGGAGLEEARNVLVDPKGHVIVSGYTTSTDFPVTADTALQPQFGGNTDVFVAVLDITNPPDDRSAELLYSTYFGGSNGDVAFDMKLDSAGNLYLAGFTLSDGLKTSATALQATWDKTLDAFALILNPSKGLQYFSYLGSSGLQIAYGIDFDANGNVFLVGASSGPIFDAFQGTAKTTDPGNTDGFLIGFKIQ